MKDILIIVFVIFFFNYSFSQNDSIKKNYNKKGHLISEGLTKNGLVQGEWKYFDDSLGYLKKIVNYKDNLNHGIYKEFYPNGIVKRTGNYDRNFIKEEVSAEGFIYTYSLPIGSWDYFNENNNLIKTVVYDCNGIIIKTIPEK